MLNLILWLELYPLLKAFNIFILKLNRIKNIKNIILLYFIFLSITI